MSTTKEMATQLQNSGFSNIGMMVEEAQKVSKQLDSYYQGCREVEDNIGKKGIHRTTQEVFVILDGTYKEEGTTYKVRMLKHPKSVTTILHHSNVIVINGGAYNASS